MRIWIDQTRVCIRVHRLDLGCPQRVLSHWVFSPSISVLATLTFLHCQWRKASRNSLTWLSKFTKRTKPSNIWPSPRYPLFYFIHWYISCLRLIKVEFFSRNEKYKPLFTNVNLQDTNAREVVLLALQEFGITEPSRYTQCLNLPEFSNIHCTITLLTNDKNCKYLIDWYSLALNEKKKLFC